MVHTKVKMCLGVNTYIIINIINCLTFCAVAEMRKHGITFINTFTSSA